MMDENVVAVHMIEASDGTIQVLTDGGIDASAEIIAANEAIQLGHIQDSDQQYIEEETHEEHEIEDQDIKQHYVLEGEEEGADEMEETAEDETYENSEQTAEAAEGDDIIIAEAVVVTQYSCKFCNRRFDTIDKVKNHYLQRHNKDQNLAQRFSQSGQQSATDEEPEENQKKRLRPAPKPKNNQYLKVVSTVEDVKNDLKKKARRPTPVIRKYPCDWPGCNYIARHSVHLKDHKRTHTGEKPYRCNWPDCGLSFIQGSALKTHMRTHTGEKPYPCTWPGCTLFFSQKNNVKVHMRTHTGEKPYACDWPGCEWKFAVKGNLDDHKRVHAGEKFFVCDWPGCTRSYTQNSHLRKHQLIHMEDKPFACDWPGCQYKSVRACDVTNHKITHTGEKRFICEFPNCGKGFARSHHLKRHQSSSHTILVEEEVEVNQ